jgi:hypothetical protein
MDFPEEYLKKVVDTTHRNGGSASKPATGKFLPSRDVWSFPKYPSRTAILPPTVDLVTELRNFILHNETYLNEDDCWLGTWIHPQTREYYLDIATGITNLDEARAMAMRISIEEGRKIVAIFNAKRNKTVFLWQD